MAMVMMMVVAGSECGTCERNQQQGREGELFHGQTVACGAAAGAEESRRMGPNQERERRPAQEKRRI
ncbi:MAG TPA: hypothetical protein VG893_09500 [Terracidiphilus sp.]|nr:hypothetical protein [Terracidiphilus sp.]